MSTWPSEYEILWESVQFTRQPVSSRASSFTGRVRQRRTFDDPALVFTVNVLLDDAQVDGFIDFIQANPNTFTGPYYTCDVEQTGDLQIQNNVSLLPQPPDHTVAGLTVKVLSRDHSIGQQLYDLAQSMGSAFDDIGSIAEALEIAVNENGL